MLVSLADMKIRLGISPGTTTYDVFLTGQIALVSEAITAYCRREFELKTYLETFYFDDHYRSGHEVKTFFFPVKEVDSFEYDVNTQTLTADDYRLHKPTGTIKTGPGFYYCNYMKIQYKAGYDVIPLPIQEVVYSIVGEKYNRKVAGVDLNFGNDVQRLSVPGTFSIDFDYSKTNNDRSTDFGMILGDNLNMLDYYRSERSIIGLSVLEYVEEVVP